eukprot:jgi/Chlat1/3335/Chrsp225S03400
MLQAGDAGLTSKPQLTSRQAEEAEDAGMASQSQRPTRKQAQQAIANLTQQLASRKRKAPNDKEATQAVTQPKQAPSALIEASPLPATTTTTASARRTAPAKSTSQLRRIVSDDEDDDMDEERNAHNDLDDELDDDDDNINHDDVAGHPPASNARAFLDDIAQVGGNQLPVAARQRAQSTRPPQVTSEVLLPAHTHIRPIAAQITAARDQAQLHSSARRDVAARVPTSGATEQRSARSASSLDVLKDYLNTAGSNEIRKAFEYFYQLPMLYNGKPTAARLAQLAALKKDSAYRRHGRLEWGDERFGRLLQKVWCSQRGAGQAPAPHVQLALDLFSSTVCVYMKVQRQLHMWSPQVMWSWRWTARKEESEATPLRVAVTKEQLAFTVAVVLQFLVNQTIQDKKDPVAYFNKVVQYVNNTHMDTLEIVNAPALPTVEGLPGGEGDLEDAEDFTI